MKGGKYIPIDEAMRLFSNYQDRKITANQRQSFKRRMARIGVRTMRFGHVLYINRDRLERRLDVLEMKS